MNPADLLDAAMEWTVVPSFTRLGPVTRSRLYDWTPLERYDLSGRRLVITGATSAEQVEHNLAAAEARIPDEARAEIEALFPIQ